MHKLFSILPRKSPLSIGVIPGEGIGPEIIQASLGLLKVIENHYPLRFDLRWGGKIGKQALSESGQALSPEIIEFCDARFQNGEPIFCGPGGERFVYDLRRRFDLYCKLAPIQPLPALSGTGPLKPAATADVDLIIVRENTGGLYQGQYGLEIKNQTRQAYHRFDYAESQVARILETAAHLAGMRSGRLCVVTKPGGAPSISSLWEDIAVSICARHGLELRLLEIDNACYQIIADAGGFDMIAAPNMFGDVLADTAALLLGSRGMSHSANYSAAGCAVYQTGHGAAYDLSGKNIANPIGQMLSLAMLLKESFGLNDIAQQLRLAINDAVQAGWRSRDIAIPGCRLLGTQELAEKIAAGLDERLAACRQQAEPGYA